MFRFLLIDILSLQSLAGRRTNVMEIFRAESLIIEEDNGIATLWLDVPGKTYNVFNRQVLADLNAAFDQIAPNSTIKLLLIRGRKKNGFMAGADLHEFQTITTPEQAMALSAAGQQLFDKLERLPFPTVAVIHGPCLGGGLEFALACDYRVAIDHPKTQIGLPEIELGLVPGWGGTQRLARVVGLERSLQVILQRKRLTAREAADWDLVDWCLPAKSEVRNPKSETNSKSEFQNPGDRVSNFGFEVSDLPR